MLDRTSPDDLAKAAATRKLDRRRLIGVAAAAGISAAAYAKTLPGPSAVRAQSTDDGLVTVKGVELGPTFIRNFNPLHAEETARWPTVAGIYEPMLIHNTMTGKIVPWLATGYAFDADNATLTFTLRDGVAWSDGHPFTAKDVAFTFELLRAHEALPGTGGIRTVLPLIDDIRAPDERTVTVTFKQVFTPALYDLGHQMIVPEHVWKDVSDPVTFLNKQPVGTGPFTEVAVFEDQYWELHRNPNYWQAGKPLVRGLRFPAFSDSQSILLALLSDEIDWTAAFIADVEKTFVAKDPAHHHYWFPLAGSDVMLYANTTRAPFDETNVRKALSMALDREQIVEVAMSGYTYPADATGLSDAYQEWKNADAVANGSWTKRDLTGANRLLDASGYAWDDGTRVLPDGTRMEYELDGVVGWSDWVSACQIMAKNLREVGINLTVKNNDAAVWIDRVQKGQFDLSIGWSTDGPTPFNFYRATMSTATVKPVGEVAIDNWHRFGNDEADRLLDQFAATSDPQVQRELADQLQFLFVEHAPAIPLFPGPKWGEYNSTRFTGFPDQNDPYALLSSFATPDRLLVLTSIRPV
ncbi:MAG: ABC transporter substrate-binding protein [Thermomicrobiales bacterium]